MNRPIKFELIWDNGTPSRVVTLSEINEMGEEFRLVAYVRQFTNLLDKNGKEIYEGDILRTSEGMKTVVFGCGGFMLKHKTNSKSYIIDGERYEIVGNICENLELIK